MSFNVKEITIPIEYTDFRSYYINVCTNYPHLKFTNVQDTVDSEKHTIDGVYGWGIQSNLEDLTVPCPPWNVHKARSDNYRDTELSFGIIKKLKALFPEARQFSLSGHPPGTIIQQHTDTDRYLKVHIPIIANPESFFEFGTKRYCLKVGKAYLINTTRLHGTNNKGSTDRVHLFFKVPAKNYI
jgi:hypothetical protein